MSPSQRITMLAVQLGVISGLSLGLGVIFALKFG